MSIKWMNEGWESSRNALSTPAHMVVWLILADHANDLGICFPLIDTIARKARMSDRNVSRLLREFEVFGIVMRCLRYKRSTVYVLRSPSFWGKRFFADELSPEQVAHLATLDIAVASNPGIAAQDALVDQGADLG